MVYCEPIMSVTQDSQAQEPNFGGNLWLRVVLLSISAEVWVQWPRSVSVGGGDVRGLL